MAEQSSLEPTDWDEFRETAHQTLDDAIDHMQGRSDQPVWQPVPDIIRESLRMPLPKDGQQTSLLSQRISTDFLPYGVGNTHPRFFGWVHGAGTPAGIVPEMFAAAMNANLGGRDHVANEVEKQVISWCRDIFGFPETASGLIVSGTSMATLIAVKSAREKLGPEGIRKKGLIATKGDLVGYTSAEAHSSVARSFDILGLGSDALRSIPTNAAFQMDSDALKDTIRADIAAGLRPFCIVATVGTVNIGSVDPISKIADIAEDFGLWLHIDGAFGALAILSERLRPLLAGIERAHSLAFDFHKWMHVNYDAGFVLMRDGEDQRHAFSERPEYLEGASRGLAAGNPWFCEYGPELSRGFRALKIWFHIQHFGLKRLGASIEQNCDQASFLAGLVTSSLKLELLAPVGLNIVCFRFDPGNCDQAQLDQLNGDIVVELQERGLAAPSTTRIGGNLAIRVNITNHRTRNTDLEFLVEQVLALGVELYGSG